MTDQDVSSRIAAADFEFQSGRKVSDGSSRQVLIETVTRVTHRSNWSSDVIRGGPCSE